jgi:hypothetical protein
MNRAAQAAAALERRNIPKPKSIMCLPMCLFRIWYPMQKSHGRLSALHWKKSTMIAAFGAPT